MNINVSVDCTPEEARRFMGLPDLQPIHDLYLAKLREAVTDGMTPEGVERLLRQWSPLGEGGMAAWTRAMERMAGVGQG